MKNKTSFLCLIMFLSLTTKAQNAWTKEKGELYTLFNFTSIANYGSLFNNDGESIALERSITERTFQLYGEFGVSNTFTFIANVPLRNFQSKDALVDTPTLNSGSLNALGNIELGIRQRLYSNKGFTASAQLKTALNTSTYDEPIGLRSDLDAFSIVPTVSVGKSLDIGYIQLFGGYAWHSNNYSGHVKWGGELGLSVLEKHWVILFLDIYDALDNGDRIDDVNNQLTGLFLNGQEYGGIGLKLIIELPKDFDLNFGFGGAIFGHLVPQQGSISIGISRDF